MEENKYQLNHTYLVKYGSSASILSVTILLITDKAYHVRWNVGMKSNTTWELKKRFDMDYNMIEDITDYMSDYNKTFYEKICDEMNKKEPKSCSTCGGRGTVPDASSTNSNKLCLECFDTKYLLV